MAARGARESATLALLWAGAALAAFGAMVVLSGHRRVFHEGLLAAAGGLLLSSVAIAVGHPLTTLRVRLQESTGGTEYDQLKRWGRLKAVSLLLQMLGMAGAVVLAFSLLVASGTVQADVSARIVSRGDIVLVGAIALVQALAHQSALRTPIDRDRTGFTSSVAFLGLAIAILLCAVSALIVLGFEDRLGAGAEAAADRVELLLLGAAIVSTYSLFLVRGLPTLTILTSEERASYRGGPKLSKAYNVFLPALVAFGLLLLVFLLFVAFGVGVQSLVSEVAHSPALLGVVLAIFAAMAASLLLAVRLARSEDIAVPLFRKPVSRKQRIENRIVGASVAAAALLALPALLTYQGVALGPFPRQAWIHFLCLAILAGIGPYGFYAAREHRRIRRLEERFPDFLRDVASSHKGGLTLNQSVTIAARGEYGPLTPEIRKMADQLSWNVPFSEALQRFAERVQTPLVERAVSLILQANRSGGATTDVLLAAARDAREIKNLENERRLSMGLYTTVIYITFFVFLTVAAVLYAQFVPQIVESSEAAQGVEGAEGSSFGGPTLRVEQFQLFYFLAAVMQGLGDGIVAGLMGSGKAVLGLRHAFLMVLISYLTFTLFLV